MEETQEWIAVGRGGRGRIHRSTKIKGWHHGRGHCTQAADAEAGAMFWHHGEMDLADSVHSKEGLASTQRTWISRVKLQRQGRLVNEAMCKLGKQMRVMNCNGKRGQSRRGTHSFHAGQRWRNEERGPRVKERVCWRRARVWWGNGVAADIHGWSCKQQLSNGQRWR